jgi:hypothetical protein
MEQFKEGDRVEIVNDYMRADVNYIGQFGIIIKIWYSDTCTVRLTKTGKWILTKFGELKLSNMEYTEIKKPSATKSGLDIDFEGYAVVLNPGEMVFDFEHLPYFILYENKNPLKFRPILGDDPREDAISLRVSFIDNSVCATYIYDYPARKSSLNSEVFYHYVLQRISWD